MKGQVIQTADHFIIAWDDGPSHPVIPEVEVYVYDSGHMIRWINALRFDTTESFHSYLCVD